MEREDKDRERLRATFGEAPELYDRARPGYPAAMFDDLAALAELTAGSRVLEIGSGTGQATLPLAERGYEVTAVELGGGMAAIAKRKLAGFPNARVVTGAFEAMPLPAAAFDAVVCATAWKWLDPAVRLVKAAAALVPGGSLAIVSTHHVAGGSEQFFVDVQRCYERWDPATPPGLRLPPASTIPTDIEELERSPLFAETAERRYEWETPYTTATYLDLLRTYSNHRALPPPALAGLLDCIAHLIDTRHDSEIVKRYLTQLHVARTSAT
jgi:SAM-dependent methyltransferase